MNQLSEQKQIELNSRYSRTMLVFWAQVATTVILTVIAWFIAGKTGSDAPRTLPNVLWIVLLVIAIGAFLLRRVMFNPEVLRDTGALKGTSGVLKNLQFKTILISALGETVAVIGFVISLMTGDKYDMLRAAAIALIIFFISFPRKKGWQVLAQSAP
ncbi:MAG: hypothetical protein M3209_16605 [Acidobacteriota bacterium]|nr:hypothetical protein [Acidobacteriota bacterium]